MWHDIRTVDLNPPLSYLLTRLSFRLFGINTLACRLPEILAFWVAMLALASFIRHRAGVLYGILAAALLFSSLAGELAIEARPYALLLAFVCLALVAWQRARKPDLKPVGQAEPLDQAAPSNKPIPPGRNNPGTSRTLALCLLPLSATGMLLSHVFGLLPWAVFAAAELTRTVRRRSLLHPPDWLPILLWIAPLAACITYAPMLGNHGASAFPPAFQPTPEDIFTFYISHIARELITLWLTALAVLILLGRCHLRGSDTWRLSTPEWVTTIGLLLLPGLLIADLMHAHAAFFPRYGVVACIGSAILATIFLSWWTHNDPRPALLASLIALLISGQIASAASGLFHTSLRHPFTSTEPTIPPCAVCARIDTLDPTLPLVAASGLTFLEMDHRESPRDLDRLFYLTDHDAAITYAHATIFEGLALEAQLFPIRAHVVPFHDFIPQHPHFFVLGQYDYPEDWLLRKLSADGATILVRGRVDSPYKDYELYEVTIRRH